MSKKDKNSFIRFEFFNKNYLSLITLIVNAVLILLIVFIFSAYNRHKDIVVKQQEEHLLTIAKSVSRGLQSLINEKKKTVNVYFDNIEYWDNPTKKDIDKAFTRYVEKFYKTQNIYFDSIYLMDESGMVIHKEGYDDFALIPSYLKDVSGLFLMNSFITKRASVSPVFMSSGKYFVLGIVKPLFINDIFKGYVICTINLDKVYEDFVAPNKVGNRGYILIKDRSNQIIMYKDKSQIGINVLEGRRKMYPNLYYADLEKLNKRQLAGETGTDIYYSYWWTEKDIPKVQKINAFTPVEIGDDFWVISVEMDYNEVAMPVRNNLNNILVLSFIILIILCFSVFYIMYLAKNTQTLKIETKYLKELNDSFIELQKSEQKAKHFQKLQTIGTMTGGIAHEFNNLLTPILGYCEILQKELPEGSQHNDDIKEIYKIARKASELVKQILVYGRNDAGIKKLRPLNISLLVKESLKTVEKIAPSSITINAKINPDCGFINADATMINQVILNLCTNAFHAMKNDYGTLTIELEKVNRIDIPELESNYDIETYTVLRISDTGCGMNEETIKRIFDPFFTTKAVGEGTGLGLWVVHNIIVEHKGDVFVKSTKGKGTTFSVYLPWLSQEIQEKTVAQDVINRKENVRLLIVDDEADIVKVLKKGLSRIGYKVYSEINPQNAVARFKANPDKYDVVITDYTMPGITGVELSRIVKQIRDDIKVMLFTGLMEDGIRELKNSGYIDDVVLKPVSCDDLDLKIQKLFKKID